MAGTSWGYADNGFGPHRWQDHYKVAKGNLQSPIDINTSGIEQDSTLGPLVFQYKKIANSTITNDGRTLQVTMTGRDSGVTGGPLSHDYQLAVMRFHWGSDNCSGSEHTIDGENFPLEVQLIHWNRDLYKNIGEAMGGDNGLCIINVFFQVSDEDNEGLTPIVRLLFRDEHKGRFSLEVKATIDPINIAKGISGYWTYPGSLTTPPLTENVTWIISQNVMNISETQMKAFRNVRNSSGEPMANQCRPVCPLNDRTVRASVFSEESETVSVDGYKDNNNNNNNNGVDSEESNDGEEQNGHGSDEDSGNEGN